VEKSGGHHLNQVIKVAIISNVTNGCHAPFSRIYREESSVTALVLPPTVQNLQVPD
jgi:hypothetical protein